MLRFSASGYAQENRDGHASDPKVHREEGPPTTPTVSLVRLVRTFAFIGATSFGGGMSGYIRKVLVEDRHWLESEEFLRGLSLAQLVPGPNAVNLAVFIGYRMHGVIGTVLAVCAVLSVPVIVLAAVAAAWSAWGLLPAIAGSIRTLGAFGVGLMAASGLGMVRAARLGVVDLVLAGVAFVAVGVVHWPVPFVLLALVFVSVCLRWLEPETGAKADT